MTSFPELYTVAHWQYRAEGNANLVLQYIGPNPVYATTMLRLRKAIRQNNDNAPHECLHVDQNTNDISKESQFASEVIGRLLGKEYVEQLIAIHLPTDFLQELSTTIEHTRPSSRRQKGIDISQAVGFLALDHTRFSFSSLTHPAVSVEIKPKWGFLTCSNFIRKEQSIKKRKCRFCMYQHTKVVSGIEKGLSRYCPIDLFSGNEFLVHDALESLVQTPQNNLRLFVNGVQQAVTPKAVEQALMFEHLKTSDAESGCTEDGHQTTLIDVLTHILIESPLLERLARLQLGLDSLDIETIHELYTLLEQGSEGHIDIQEPSFEEYLTTAQTFLERTDMDALMSESRHAFVAQNASSLGFGAEDRPEDIPDSLKLHFIREFLLSATLKDCSILITVRQLDNLEQPHQLSRSSTINSDSTSAQFKEASQRITVGGSPFEYKMTCIDLDPKKMSSVPKYLVKDREIVQHYLLTMGDREQSCGSFCS